MPDEPLFWTVAELVAAYRTGALSPVEVTRGALSRIEAFNDDLHSYLSVAPEIALEQARRSERAYRDGGPTGDLEGVPVSVKDLFDVAGMPTTLGSRLYGERPAEADSEPVAAWRRAGAVVVGKTNTAEFGQSATTDNLLGPACGNPWDPTRTAGGSSGGAAASVGAGLATIALGSDGGGSIRIPAALSGVFGLKPTYREPSDEESFKAMSAFVCAGPLARTVDDARRGLAVQLGRSFASSRAGRRLRIGWSPSPGGHPVDPAVRRVTAEAVTVLGGLGHEVDEADVDLDGWFEVFGPIVLDEERRHRSHLLTHADELTKYARAAIEHGQSVTPGQVERARAGHARYVGRIQGLFVDHDLIVMPTAACLPFPHDWRPSEIDGVAVHPIWGPFPFTAPFNVAGNPAASVPVGIADGLPVALQVVGRHDQEGLILDLCEELEGALPSSLGRMAQRWAAPAPAPQP